MFVANTSTTNIELKKLFFFFLVAATMLLGPFFSCNQQSLDQSASSQAFTKTILTAQKLYNNNPDKGIHYLDSAITGYKDVGVANLFEAYELHCAYFYHARVNYPKAMLYADSMVNLIQNSGNVKAYGKQLGIAYFSKGDVYFATERFPEAYRYYYLGKVTGKNNFDNCTLSDYSYRMGMIMYKQEHFSLAANYFKESTTEIKDCTMNFVTFYRVQELLDNTAISYDKAGLRDSARVYFDKTLAYINQEANKYPERARLMDVSRAVVYGNQAKLYMTNRDTAKAEDLLKKSIAINVQKDNDNKDAELSELKLAHIYADRNDNTNLILLLRSLRIQLDSVKNPDAEVDWNHLMAGYYQKQNDAPKALRYFDHYDFLKDSVAKSMLDLKQNDVNHLFKDFENQSTINSLKNENLAQLIYTWVAAVCAGMALVIVGLIFFNWRKSRRNVIVLSDLNQKIHEQNESLQRAFLLQEINSKEKDRILRAVAHDLRNPIGGIASLTSLMLMEENLDAEQRELTELIQTATNNSLELINEILEATGMASGNPISKQMVDINTLLSNSVDLLKFKAAEKNQKIMLDMLESPEELYISREKIWRVISNLISNAIKFSPNDSVIQVSVVNEGDNIRISVNDHGIGIPDAIKNIVFNMFTQAKRIGTAGEPSFGLGLSISKQIIESHGGQIWFESSAGEGTTFYIRLKKSVA